MPKLKEDFTRQIVEKPVSINVRCQDCLFFKRQAAYGKPCNQLGRIEASLPCRRFQIDPYSIDFMGKKLDQFFDIVGELTYEEAQKVAALIIQDKKLHKMGLGVGHKAYVKIVPSGKYVSDYSAIRVVSATREYVFGAGKNNMRVMMYPSSLISKEKWLKMKARMEKKGMLKNPHTPTKLAKGDPKFADANVLRKVAAKKRGRPRRS